MEGRLGPFTDVYIGHCSFLHHDIPMFLYYDGGRLISVECNHSVCRKSNFCKLYQDHAYPRTDPRVRSSYSSDE